MDDDTALETMCSNLLADAVAQGYGFLSENSTFVDICSDHGIEFIGPRSEHIRTMGDKSTARDTMKVSPGAHYSS